MRALPQHMCSRIACNRVVQGRTLESKNTGIFEARQQAQRMRVGQYPNMKCRHAATSRLQQQQQQKRAMSVQPAVRGSQHPEQ